MRKSLVAAAAMTGALLVQPALADRATVMASCEAQLRMDADGCACIADRAARELNEKQYAFFVARISGGEGANDTMSGMTGEEAMEVATFMSTAPSQCAAH